MRFATQFVLLCVAAVSMPAQSPSASPAPQQQADFLRTYAHASPYMDLPVEDLKSMLRSLGDLRPGTRPDAESILERAAGLIQAQLPRIPNLLAREDIADENLLPPLFLRSGPRTRSSVERSFYASRFAPGSWRHFEYVIRTYNHPPDLTEFHESRVDLAKQTSNKMVHGTGFGTAWIIFVPGNLSQSRFRYLGQQKVDGSQTFVFAFAQDPEKVRQAGIIEDASGPVPLLLQGVAWVDQKSYRIVRVRTDLLDRLPSIQLDNLTSTVSFSEVHIPELPDRLWLPREVELTWISHGRSAGELHRYSHYQLFRSTVRILPD